MAKRIITILGFHTSEKYYKNAASRLKETALKVHPTGRCDVNIIHMKERGGNRDLFGEALIKLYRKFSASLCNGPVMFVGADCYFNSSVLSYFRGVQGNWSGWDISAVWRKAANQYGPQNFIDIVIFNNNRPNVCRKFWLDWISEIYSFVLREHAPAKNGHTREWNRRLKKKGWYPSWYSDQTAFNILLRRARSEDGFYLESKRIMKLDKNIFSADPSRVNKNVVLVHDKGTNKF